jgi:hypothetical protein
VSEAAHSELKSGRAYVPADWLVKLTDAEFAAEVHAALQGEGKYAFSGDDAGVGGGGSGVGTGRCCSPRHPTHSEPSYIVQILLATSLDATQLNKQGFSMRWMTWRAISARPYGEGVIGGLFGRVFGADVQEKVVSRMLRPATEAAIGAAAAAAAEVDARTGAGDRQRDSGQGLEGGPGPGPAPGPAPAFAYPPAVTGAAGQRGAFPLATQHAG